MTERRDHMGLLNELARYQDSATQLQAPPPGISSFYLSLFSFPVFLSSIVHSSARHVHDHYA